ncbi:MAG: NUDIX domain-containing protein, partial [Simkaniaceae bacterium]|nr:NUDIX domain-containing protein [Simkaniaceae bacterium]
ALLSFAFQKKIAAVDGNVLRVIARMFGVDGDIRLGSVKNEITAIVEKNLPEIQPFVVMEGLIELGALVCRKKPLCGQCPLRLDCVAFREKKQNQLPYKSPGKKTIRLHRSVAVIERSECFLIRKKETGVMADLWEFLSADDKDYKWNEFPLKVVKLLPEVTHTFTRYHATLYPTHYCVESDIKIEDARWVAKEHLEEYPFSSGHRQIMRNLLDCNHVS